MPVFILIIAVTIFSFHGLDTTDESFVLLSIINWKTSYFNSFFGFVLFPFWQLSFQNIVLFRLLGFFLLWFSSFFFTVSLAGLVAPSYVEDKYKIRAALSSLIPFTYYVNERVWTPNYNWAVLFFALLASGSYLVVTRPDSTKNTLFLSIFAFSSLGLSMSKPISVFFVAILVVLLFLSRRRSIDKSFVLAIILLVLIAILLFFFSPLVDDAKFIYQTMRIFNPDSYSLGNLFTGAFDSVRYGIVPFGRFLLPVLLPAIALLTFLHFLSKSSKMRRLNFSIHFSFIFTISFFSTLYTFRNYSEFNRFAILAFIIQIVWLFSRVTSHLSKVLLIDLFIVISYGFGSGNGLWPKSSGACGVFIVSFLLCAFELRNRTLISDRTLYYSLVFPICILYLLAFQWLVTNPYRQVTFSRQTMAVAVANFGSVRLEPRIAEDIQHFMESLNTAGYKETDRILNLTGLTNSHLLLFSKSQPPKMVFLMERTFPNAEHVLRENLSRDPQLSRRSLTSQWLILPENSDDSYLTRSQIEGIFAEIATDISLCYKKVYTSTLGYSLWQPICTET